MDQLSAEDRAAVQEHCQLLGRDLDPEFQLVLIRTDARATEALKKVAGRLRPNEDIQTIKRILDLPASNVILSVPKTWTKLEVMTAFMKIKGPGLNTSRINGRLAVLVAARSGDVQHEKCERCTKDGSRPFEKCVTWPGEKNSGCATCLRLYWENGEDEEFKCSFQKID